MEKEVEFVDVEQKAKECRALPFFIMDITSGELLSIFSVSNIDTAIRSFKMNMDAYPENLVHDCILVRYDGREVVFEGKDYLDEWHKKQDAKMQKIRALGGM